MAKVGYVRNDYNPLRKIRRYVQNLKISVEGYEAFDLPPLLNVKAIEVFFINYTRQNSSVYIIPKVLDNLVWFTKLESLCLDRIQFCKYTVVRLSELLQNIRLRSIKLIFDARHDPHSSSNDVELFFSSISDQVILERIAFDFSAVDDQLLLEVISSLRFEDSKIVFLDLRATSSRRNDLVYLQLQETLAQIINRSSNLKELKLDNFLVDD
ncbi:hypothetical protein HK098_002620 [Nowakowskiella sp. JEL0407]|nr:hypothetical protein HK098_002620 [Nowakowskiella sp. JEL0407]